jgi:hypothetical protein
MEAIESIKKFGVPYTPNAHYFVDAIKTFVMEPLDVCASALLPTSDNGLSVLNTHAYYLLYPLAFFSLLFSSQEVLAFFHCLTFISLIGMTYWILRKEGVSILGALAFCFLTLNHPAWSHAGLGDFYLDRFYMPFALVFLALIYYLFKKGTLKSNAYITLIFIVGFIASLATERAAIMISFISFSIFILFWKNATLQLSNFRWMLFVFALFLLAYVYLYIHFIYVPSEAVPALYSMLGGIISFFNKFKDHSYFLKVYEFLAINILFFGILSFFNWRLSLLALASLIPNLFFDMGGAEKIGWLTHYHSMYFPVLLFTTSLGFSKLWNKRTDRKYQLSIVCMIIVISYPLSHFSKNYGNRHGLIATVYDFYSDKKNNKDKKAEEMNRFHEAIPLNAKVSAPEYAMPMLFPRVSYYYPIGISQADYIILSKTNVSDNSFYYAGATSYLGKEKDLDICLTKRLKEIGFNLEHPKLIFGNTVILERN